MEKLLTPIEVADTLRLGRLAVYKMVKAGKIRAIRLPNGKLRIPENELARILGVRTSIGSGE